METATVLVDVGAARMKAIEVNDLKTWLAELEESAATVDLPGPRHMRRL